MCTVLAQDSCWDYLLILIMIIPTVVLQANIQKLVYYRQALCAGTKGLDLSQWSPEYTKDHWTSRSYLPKDRNYEIDYLNGLSLIYSDIWLRRLCQSPFCSFS